MKEAELSLETRAIHAGRPKPRIEGAAVMPIFQCAVYEHQDEGASYEEVRYPRLNNLPGHAALARKLAALEGGEVDPLGRRSHAQQDARDRPTPLLGGGTCRKRMHSAADITGAEIMRTIRDEARSRTLRALKG